MKRLLKGVLAFALSISLLPLQVAMAADFPANPMEKEGYTLDFHDEFDGTQLDKTKWTDYYLPHWTNNPENAKANYRMENGCLVEYITEDQKPWSPEHDGKVRSSAIMSFDKSWIHNFSGTDQNNDRDTWVGYATKYGYFEMRAKLADCGGGGHQAWWMVGMQNDTNDWFNSKQTGEIDILETFFSTPNAWRIAAYGWNDPNFQTSWYLSQEQVPSGSPTEEFHIYAMDWTPKSLKFYYDNQLYKVIYDAPRYEMGTILNIYTDAGSGVHNNVWPKEWAIDYFRVYKSDAGYDEDPDVNDKFLIQNRHTGKYIYIDEANEDVLYADAGEQVNDHFKWYQEPVDGYIRLKNAATEEYLHIEDTTGKAQHGKVPQTYWSAQWKPIGIDRYVRFNNRENDGQVLHTEQGRGYVQHGDVPQTYWSAQWKLIPID